MQLHWWITYCHRSNVTCFLWEWTFLTASAYDILFTFWLPCKWPFDEDRRLSVTVSVSGCLVVIIGLPDAFLQKKLTGTCRIPLCFQVRQQISMKKRIRSKDGTNFLFIELKAFNSGYVQETSESEFELMD